MGNDSNDVLAVAKIATVGGLIWRVDYRQNVLGCQEKIASEIKAVLTL
jgi:hypothetical protein